MGLVISGMTLMQALSQTAIGYDLDDQGNVKHAALGAWTAAVFPEDILLVALELVPSEEALDTGERVKVQMSLSRNQARMLGQNLLDAANAPYLPKA